MHLIYERNCKNLLLGIIQILKAKMHNVILRQTSPHLRHNWWLQRHIWPQVQINSRHICRHSATAKRSDQTAVALVTGVRCKWPDSSWPNLLPSQHMSARIWLDMCLLNWHLLAKQVESWRNCDVLGKMRSLFRCVWQSSGWTSRVWKDAAHVWVCICVFMSDYRAEETFCSVFLLLMLSLSSREKNPCCVDLPDIHLFIHVGSEGTSHKELLCVIACP